jgi:hypothetical protein
MDDAPAVMRETSAAATMATVTRSIIAVPR